MFSATFNINGIRGFVKGFVNYAYIHNKFPSAKKLSKVVIKHEPKHCNISKIVILSICELSKKDYKKFFCIK